MAAEPHDPSRRPPAWYPDPERPSRLRYWDGTMWSGRGRPRPIWSSDGPDVLTVTGRGVVEGPAQVVELPAPAAEVGTTSRQAGPAPASPADGPPGVSSTTDPARPIRRPADDGPRPPGGPDGSGGDDGEGEPGPRRSRRRWFFLAMVAVLAAGSVALAGEALRPRTQGPRVLTDRHYIELANAECDKTLTGLRPPDAGPFGTSISPPKAAADADTAADGIDRLAATLQGLPAAVTDRPAIDTWLDGWHHYADLGHQYATFLRQHGSANPSRQLRDGYTHQASTADHFALANGLKACTFAATPVPDPSNGF